MRTPFLLAALGLLAAGAAGAPAQAAWQDTVPVSGAMLSTVTPEAPVVSCWPLTLGGLKIDWNSVPNATGYVMTDTWGTHHYGPDETEEIYYLVGGATLTVQAKFGSWLSPHSNEVTWAIVLFGGSGGCE